MAESIGIELEPIPNSEVPEEADNVGNVSIRESELGCCLLMSDSAPKYNIPHLHAAVLSPKCMCKSLLIQTQKRPGLRPTPARLVNPEQDPSSRDVKHPSTDPPSHHYLRINIEAPN
jgi:hypothetical protein